MICFSTSRLLLRCEFDDGLRFFGWSTTVEDFLRPLTLCRQAAHQVTPLLESREIYRYSLVWNRRSNPRSKLKARDVNTASQLAMKSLQRGTVRIISQRSLTSLGLRLYSTRPETDGSTHFGFQTVPESKKEELGNDNLLNKN